MTENSTFVDTIREATRQRWRRRKLADLKSAAEEKPRMGRWPPPRRTEWRLALRKPWKLWD